MAATSASRTRPFTPNFSPSLCSVSSDVYVRCKSPKNVSSTPLPDIATAGEHRLFAAPGELGELGVGADVGEIALVELDDQRHLPDLHAVGLEVLAQIDESGGVVLGFGELRIGDESHAVGPLQHEPARRAVNHLSRHREQLDADRDLFFSRERERQHVEEERTIVPRLEGHESARANENRRAGGATASSSSFR